MQTTDTRLTTAEKLILAGMIGKKLDCFSHDRYLSKSVTYQSAWICVEGHDYEIRNEEQQLVYLGDMDSVAVIGIREVEPTDVHSGIVGRKLDTEQVGKVIDDVLVYEDVHTCATDGVDTDEYTFTAAIVFVLQATELVFMKHIYFSEDISIFRGPGARKNVYVPEVMLEESAPPRYVHRASREVVSLREWSKSRV